MNALSIRQVATSWVLALTLFCVGATVALAQEEVIISDEATVSEEIPADIFVSERDTLTPPSILLVESEESSTTPQVVVEENTSTDEVLEEVSGDSEVATVIATQGPELSTDKEEYAPEETATIFGKFFGSLKTVVLRFVAGSLLEPEEVYFEDTATVTTDEEGSFAFNYQLSHIFAPLYRIFAEDEEGNVLAEDSFIDPLSTDFKQCANETGTCDWIGSILQSSNSVYYEGMIVPQRLMFRDAAIVNGNHTITFSYSYTKAGIHAYDFLATVNPKLGIAQGNGGFTPGTPNLDPCGGLAGPDLTTCNALNPSVNTPAQIIIPNDSFDSKDASATGQTDKENAFEAMTGMDRYISAYSRGGTITFGTPTLVHSPAGANSDTGDSEVNVTIPFTSSGCAQTQQSDCDILLFFGGHLALSGDGTGESWGAGLGSSNISGGPYHIKSVKFDGTGGSQDNPFQGSDILLPPEPGKIIVVKQTIPDGNATDFTFNPSWSAQDFVLSDGEQNDSGDLDAGVYSVSETVPNGWTQTSATCDDGSPVNAIDVAEGETVTCTFTNTLQQGSLTLVKTVTNDNGGTAATTDWTLSANGPTPISGTTGSGSVTNAAVNAGSYTLSESTGPAGYTAGAWGCTGATVDGNQVTVPAGGNVTCTINNNDNAPSLTLVKEVINDNGGSAAPEEWDLIADGYDAQSPNAGTYDLSEANGPAGYTQTSLTCDNSQGQVTSVTLGLGEDVTCTFVNNDNAPVLHLRKIVVNDNGGSATVADFTLTANGTGANDISGNSPVDSGAGLDADTFALSETSMPGYTASAWSCVGGTQNGSNITLGLGQEATCTITNDDQQAYITVVKVVTNDNGGDSLPDDFDLTLEGNPVLSGVQVPVNPGTYTAGETLLSGYTFEGYTGDCDSNGDVTVALGESKTCTLTNNDQQSYIIVDKTVINDNGGTALPNDFLLTVNGNAVQDGIAYPVNPGAHKASETLLTGYTAGDWGGDCDADGDVTVALGQTKTCTITNDDNAPSLTLVKEVVNDDGGNAVVTDWTLTADGPTDISGAGGAVSDASFSAGTYALSESAGPGGYTAGDWNCVGGTQDGASISLSLGESATCTIINDDIAPTITLIKNVINDNGGTALPNDFGLTIGGNPSVSGNTYDVLANTPIALNEAGLAGYSFVDITGDTKCPAVLDGTVTLDEDEDITCTITNNDNAPILHLRKVVINDNGGSATLADFTLTANGTGANDISGNSPVDSGAGLLADTFALSETNVSGYTASDWVCVGGTQNGSNITLGLGQEATCTITNDDQQAYITVTKVVTNDNGGSAQPDDFDLTLEGNAVSSGVQVPVNPGTYTAGETLLSGYTFEGYSGDCDNNGDVTVALGESKTCTLTNNDQQSYIVVNKTVVNDDGGTAAPNDFLLKVDGNAVSDEVAYAVNPGAHKASETLLTGYTASDWGTDCDADGDVTVALGQTKTCTITNDDNTPSLKLVKTVVTDNGGNEGPDDWTLTAEAQDPDDDRNISTLGGSDDFSNIYADTTYVLDETGPSGYTAGAWSCDGGSLEGNTLTVALGEQVTCTIENNDIAPTITLIKNVVNNNGGSAGPNDFGLTIGGNPSVSGNTYDVLANTPIALNEAGLAGYSFVDITGDTKCPAVLDGTVTLDEDEDVTCTIKNDDQQAYITVTKVVNNNYGGTALPNDFALKLEGNAVTSGVQVPVNPGTYTASETLLDGYAFDGFTDDCDQNGDVTVALGESKTCTLTNSDIQPKLKLVKTVNNQYGGTAVADDFQGSVTGTDVDWDVFVGFNAGNYDVNETGLPGYTAGDWGGDCAVDGAVTLDIGEEKTCTITNSDLPAEIHGMKFEDVNGDGIKDVGDNGLSDWTIFLDTNGDGDHDGGEPSTTTAGDGSYSFTGLSVGTYKVREVQQAGWTQTTANPADIELTNDEVVNDVDFGNYAIKALEVSKTTATTFTRTHQWEITKTVDDDVVDIFTGDSQTVNYDVDVTKTDSVDSAWSVSGNITITNPNAPVSLTASISNIVDSISNQGGATVTCPGGLTQDLAPGETLECTYSKALTDGDDELNTATVSTTGLVPGGEGTADVAFGDPTTVINDDINVTDTFEGDLGDVTDSHKFEYDRVLTCGDSEGEYEGLGNKVPNTATITETGQDADEEVTVNCYDLTVTKDASTSYTKTWTWDIDKTSTTTTLNLAPGQIHPVYYKVTVSATSQDSDHAATGVITITNPAPVPASITGVTDILTGNINATVDCEGATEVPAEGEIECTYEVDLANDDTLTNTAEVTMTNGTKYSGTAEVNFANATVNEVDESIDVVDDKYGPLGTVLASEAPETFDYVLNVGPYEATTCGTTQKYDNTAELTTNNTSTTDTDTVTIDANVRCTCSLTQGYWKTHNDSFHGGAPTDDNWENVTPNGELSGFFTLANSFPVVGPNPNTLTWYSVFWTAPKGNVYYNMAHQYMAAKLNVLNGAYNPTINAQLTQAENLLKLYTPSSLAGLKGKKATDVSKQFQDLAGKFAAFNEGTTNPAGHCTEIPL